MLLCTCSIHLYLFIFSFYRIFQRQLPLKKAFPPEKWTWSSPFFKNDPRILEEIRKFSVVVIYESLLTSYIHTRVNIILSYLFQALDFLYVKLLLVHKRRKRKRLISQFLQSRIEGLINWIWGGFHTSWVFKWFF